MTTRNWGRRKQWNSLPRRLPDALTLPLIACGLGFHFLSGGAQQLGLAFTGAVLGFGAFWCVARFYRIARGADGLGLGDAKLLAAAGAWLGPLYLAPVVFFGAVLALLYVQVRRIRGDVITTETVVPFGPFLCAAFFGFRCLRVGVWPSLL